MAMFPKRATKVLNKRGAKIAQPDDIHEIPVIENQAEAGSDVSTIALLRAEFNSLLGKLKDCGLMEADEEETPEGAGEGGGT